MDRQLQIARISTLMQIVIGILPPRTLDPLTGFNDSDSVLHDNSKLHIGIYNYMYSWYITLNTIIFLQNRTP